MNKPFRVCLLPVLPVVVLKKVHHIKEKVGCKRGIEIVDRYRKTNTASLLVVLTPDGIKTHT